MLREARNARHQLFTESPSGDVYVARIRRARARQAAAAVTFYGKVSSTSGRATPASVELRPRHLDHLGPFVVLGPDEARGLLGIAVHHRNADAPQLLL